MINLRTPLGSFNSKGIIKDVIIENINVPNSEKPKPKVCFYVDSGKNKLIRINEAFVFNYNGSKKQQGFWLSEDSDGNINALSTIGRMMSKYNVKTLEDFKEKEIDLYVGEKGLLVGDTT
jgi:hypothetical protein